MRAVSNELYDGLFLTGDCPSCELLAKTHCHCGTETMFVTCSRQNNLIEEELSCKNQCTKKVNFLTFRCNQRVSTNIPSLLTIDHFFAVIVWPQMPVHLSFWTMCQHRPLSKKT